ncbi:MAG TPA: nicotinate-nucleotide adenylyltransferase [Flavobacteriales bacterium]|nr:nicotinate-nucleotide adenylyltransferase [Flavobacteriales bacterium]HIO68901.1 nicotinate-nucleotide adenylyltransferase [Flavobacteriales bacterium]
MKIGLFFGSFNPIHRGHLKIASYFLDNSDLQEIWLVVSPKNPLKEDEELLDVKKRLELVHAAIGENELIKCCEVELGLPIPSFTIDTLRNLRNTNPDDEFIIIMGSDNLEKFHLWKDYTEILDQYKIYVYPRSGASSGQFAAHPSVSLIDSQLLEISASMLRDQIRKEEFDLWLPDKVAQIIRERGYYSNSG